MQNPKNEKEVWQKRHTFCAVELPIFKRWNCDGLWKHFENASSLREFVAALLFSGFNAIRGATGLSFSSFSIEYALTTIVSDALSLYDELVPSRSFSVAVQSHLIDRAFFQLFSKVSPGYHFS
jgi:hypothetical protein